MTFEEMEDYLLSIPKFGKKHSIELVGKTLVKIGVVQESFQVIHVAGTNGKGSVCAFLNSILLTGNKRVGMFTSPHLVQMRERFMVNGKMVSKEKVLEAFYHIMDKIDKNDHPNFFEMMFYLAMYLFQQEQVDYVILETGVGGRLDATNCIQKPILTILTQIGKDHMDYLGNTYEEIAKEKAGIIKTGVPVVCISQREVVVTVLRQKARETNSQFIRATVPNEQNYRIHYKKIDFSIDSSYYSSIRVMIPSIALYQIENVTLVLRAMELLAPKIGISKEEIIGGIERTNWPGRMEEVETNIYVDGAHNIDGICVFLQNVRVMKHRESVLLFSVVGDKDYESMIREIVKSQLFTKIIVTQIESYRGMASTAIEQVFRKYGFPSIQIIETVEKALIECRRLEKQGRDVYIVGSLYLVGAVKEIIEKTN